MNSIAVVAKNAVRNVKHRSPALLTGFAVAGVISTSVLAAQAAIKASRRLDEAQGEHGDSYPRPTRMDVLKLVWPLYIPAAVVGASTIACIIGAQSINARRQAAIVGAFTISEQAFQEYRDQITESLGKTKDQKIHDELVQKHVNENPPPETLIIGSDKVLCLDTYTGRYFESTAETIRKAQNDFNEGLLNGEMYMSLNEFYHFLGLPDTVVGEQVGFSPENIMDIQFSSALTEEKRPCLAISFRALPRQDYFRFQ